MNQNLQILELGPGDSIASAIIGFSYGASCTFLVDVDYYVTKNLNFYRKLISTLKSKGFRTPDISEAKSVEDLLKSCNGIYLTKGLSSLKSIESNSINFVWSHSVLEHIRKYQFFEIQRELKRLLKPSGKASHNIDFQDHLDYGLNNLRFSEKIWESKLFANSGFYTNRLPAVEIHRLFKNKGFKLINENFGKWDKLPIKRNKVNNIFNQFSDRELAISTSSFLGMKI